MYVLLYMDFAFHKNLLLNIFYSCIYNINTRIKFLILKLLLINTYMYIKWFYFYQCLQLFLQLIFYFNCPSTFCIFKPYINNIMYFSFNRSLFAKNKKASSNCIFKKSSICFSWKYDLVWWVWKECCNKYI